MKKMILMLSIVTFVYGCSENSRALFDAKPSVYFASYTVKDTVKYSFTMTQYSADTLYVGVTLIGRLTTGEARFELQVNGTSTAVAGTHYKEIPGQIVFPEGQTNYLLPIIVLDNDATLKDHSVLLSVSIVPTNDFDVGWMANSTFNVAISDMLVKPTYWVPNINNAFGEYSTVKHERAILIMGHDFPLTSAEMTAFDPGTMPGIKGLKYWQLMGRRVCDYFVNNPTLDENGNLIGPWETL